MSDSLTEWTSQWGLGSKGNGIDRTGAARGRFGIGWRESEQNESGYPNEHLIVGVESLRC